MPFPPDLRDKLLLWCDRHCCLCKKACDVFIEVHHIDPNGDDDEDNALPLCFECHGRVSHYDPKQPIGTKFKSGELKGRRDQIYDEYTRHLVPALSYKVHQSGRVLPDVGFTVLHLGDAPPIQTLVTISGFLDGTPIAFSTIDPLYRGTVRWNLNPKVGVSGHFPIPTIIGQRDIRIGVSITIHDVFDRAHKLLPVTYVYSWDRKEWWLDPVDPRDSARRAGKTD
jgi:hypothetical protein